MKKLIFLITMFISSLGYASFPVFSNTHIEVVNEINVENSTVVNATPVFGILSIICSIIALLIIPHLLMDQLYLFFIFSIAALVFGIIGMSRQLKVLSRIGFLIGLLETVILSFILLWVVVLGSGRFL